MKMDGIKLFKLGIICKPPTLVLLYEVSEGPDKGPGRRACRRKRSMPIRDLSKACSSQCGGLAQQLKKRHEKYLGKVSTVVIEKMLRLLYIVTLGNKSVAEAVDEVQTEFTVNLDEDMNRLSDRDLNRRKELMDLTFERNRIKVGDPDFVYDKQVNQKRPMSNLNAKTRGCRAKCGPVCYVKNSFT